MSASVNLDLDHDLRLVSVTVVGEVDDEQGRAIITEARKAAAEHGYNAIYDVREAIFLVPLSKWFFLPRDLEVLQQAPTRDVKAAVLISAEFDATPLKFYENVAQNMGLSFRLFSEESAALDWLIGE